MKIAFPELQVLAHEQCTKKAVLEGIRGADIVHLACHAVASQSNPIASHLFVANDEQITVGELSDDRVNAELVVLSACETNVGGRLLADEGFTLCSALLQASAQATIGALWIAPDAATSIIMTKFYELWIKPTMSSNEPPLGTSTKLFLSAFALSETYFTNSRVRM